jgi:hypothetical protein
MCRRRPSSVRGTNADSPAYQGKPACEHHFAALKRLLDRREPDYSD